MTLKKLKQNRFLLSSDKIRVYESEKISTPILIGLICPAIYLPKDFCRKDLAIDHELCHLRRGDIWMKWILQIVVCIHWFNPAVYYLRWELNRLAELACDKYVIKNLDDNERKSYGRMLLETAKSVSGSGGMMFALSRNNKQLLQERIKEIMKNSKVTKKVIITMLFLVFCVVGIATIAGTLMLSNASESTLDNIDMPFVNDPDVVGTWISVDFVKNISDFDPANKFWQANLYLEKLTFLNNGELSVKTIDMKKTESAFGSTWTKGYVLSQTYETASKYEIREIDGSKYMFFEWKSGDYIIRHMTPCYYILKKVN